ncbi:hypothetical protein V6N13_093425 [Hibiscus sabdariffa]|uniref:Uncharacterized protein n=2 Tax=Hibiscus sabdariffa TaxID=183260 RepID=A0ABR2BRE8_9ROSI
MSTSELLSIPQELQFHIHIFTFSNILEFLTLLVPELVELRKQISCSLNLSNKTDNYVAFKVKTTNPKKYCVRPNTGVVFPRSTCNVIVTMQAQKEAPPDMQCKDKFLLQSVVASPGATPKDITPEMFNKEPGHDVEECKLRVVYVAPPRPPSPVREGSSPTASVSENGSFNAAELSSVSFLCPQKLREEKNSVVQQNNKLQQELELLRRDAKKAHGGIPFVYIILVGLVGNLLKRT